MSEFDDIFEKDEVTLYLDDDTELKCDVIGIFRQSRDLHTEGLGRRGDAGDQVVGNQRSQILEKFHSGLRAVVKKSRLMDGIPYMKDIEDLYRHIWKDYCTFS